MTSSVFILSNTLQQICARVVQALSEGIRREAREQAEPMEICRPPCLGAGYVCLATL